MQYIAWLICNELLLHLLTNIKQQLCQFIYKKNANEKTSRTTVKQSFSSSWKLVVSNTDNTDNNADNNVSQPQLVNVNTYTESLDPGCNFLAKHMLRSVSAACICHKCIEENKIQAPGMEPFLLNSIMMILCPICGNKRCPHASDHNLACTGSNDSGQPGSVYE